MKKITFLNMKEWYMLFLFAFVPYLSNGQCTNSIAYLTVTSNNTGQIQQIGTCTFVTEYNTINGLLVGEDYIFTATNSGDKYVTITTVADVVIAHGPSPLVVNAISATSVRLHVSENATCTGGGGCHTTTVQFLADCPSPIALGITNLTTTTATANWTAVGPGTEWDIEYGPTGFVQGTGTLVSDLTATTYNLIGLTPATTYQFYVRSECATEDSLWSLPFSFATNCVTVTAFSENFDSSPSGFNTALPNCWLRSGSPFDCYLESGSIAPASAPNRLYMYGFTDAFGATVTYAAMPIVSNLSAGTHRLRFRAFEGFNAAGGVIEVGYLTNATDFSSYQLIATVTLGTGTANSQEFTIIPGTIPATAVRLVFKNSGVTDGSTNAYIDDVSWEAIPTCLEPSALFVSEITSSSATIAWAAPSTAPANGYQYYLSTSSTNPTAATPATGAVAAGITELDLTALTPATQYYIWIRSACSATEFGIWVGSATFSTLCVPVTSYVENFDSIPSGFNAAMPTCWNEGGNANVYINGFTQLPMSAPNSLVMEADADVNPPTESIAAMPIVSNLAAGTHRLRFKAYNSFGADRFLEIGYLTNASDFSTYQFITSVDLPTSSVNAQQFIVVPGALPATAVRLVFKNTSIPGDFTVIYIDDVRWEAIPTCVEPIDLTTSGVLATTATISWTAPSPAPANGYEYYLSTTSTEPTAATTPTGSVAAGITTATLNALTPTTQYYVWVRSVCSITEKSFWTTAISFTTPCASFTPDYLQDFAVWAPFPVSAPSCWERYGAGTVATGPTGAVNSGSWFQDGYLNNGFEGAAKINIYSTAPTGTGWLVSPVFNLATGGYQVKYKVGATQWNSTNPITQGAMGSDDFVYVLMSTDGGATWTNLTTYSATNTPSHLGTTATFNIPTVTSSTVKFAFYGTSGSVLDTQDVDFFIDDFEVQTIPSAAPVCSTNVTATIAPGCGNNPTVIAWNASAGSDGYKLTIGTTTGGSDILNNLVVGGLTYSFTGSLNTTYYYKVVPFNTNGDATGCAEQSFTTAATGCFCPSLPTSIDGSGMTQMVLGASTFPISIAAAPFYQDNTATIVPFEQNVLANVQITYNTLIYDYNTYIWIDFNNNFIFEPSELVFSGVSASTSPNTLNASFTMPATAALGAHRMRITGADFMPVANPCYSGSYAMTLDYTVNVIEEDLSTGSFDSANFKYYPNPVTDVLTLSYSSTISEVVVYNLLGQQMLVTKPNVTQTQMDLSSLTTGTYLVKISSDEVTKTVKVVKN
jgi:hypothetical protein